VCSSDLDVYAENIQLASWPQLWDLAAGYDLVHCHNEPDLPTVAALGARVPVIHDTHDLISLRAGGDPNLAFFEGLANRGATGRVYTTPYQLEEARQLYGVEGPSLVLMNYAAQEDLPHQNLPKLSAGDGRVHMVYEGGLGGNAHRDFSELFVQLARGGLVLHIHPTSHDPALAEFFGRVPNVHYYHPISPREIMTQLTRYDVGIIPFNLAKGNRRFLDSTVANKLFEYLAAGLPVVASDLQSYRDYFAANPVGFTYSDARDLLERLPGLLAATRGQDLSAHARTYESEIHRLEEFYFSLLEARPQGEVLDPSLAPSEAGAQAAQLVPSPQEPWLRLEKNLGQALLRLHQWVAERDWTGWDPYD
jgi:glycosyltransferase involved in cell wall biosynthesis